MKWIAKAIFQHIIYRLPYSTKINYFIQNKIFKNLPLSSDEIINDKAKMALMHYNSFKKYHKFSEGMKYFEFGAGWDFAVQLSLVSLGLKDLLIIDLRNNLMLDLFNDTVAKINKNINKLKEIDKAFEAIPDKKVNNTNDIKEYYDIEYQAPFDARNTNLPDESIDLCSNTATLEHIPEEDLFKIFYELHRIIKKDGIVSCIVDMKDHHSYFDKSLSVYNYLKFGKKTWNLVNPDFNYQNRLRYNHYLEIFKKTGFEILYTDYIAPTEDDIKLIDRIDKKGCKDAESLTSFEIGIKSCHVVLRKR